MEEKKQFKKSIIPPLIFVALLWIIKLSEEYFHFNLVFLGIVPLTAEGFIGIFTAPFIHANYDHLLSNTLPLLVVVTGLIYFYKEIAYNVIAMIWLFTDFWVWLAARPSSHIGASGLIYGFVCFLFFSGIIRRNKNLLAISMLVAFLYGSMVWGILPVNQTISWESHLFGSVAGIFAAIYFRKEGPQRIVKIWEEEKDSTEPEYWMTEEQRKKFPPPPPPEQPTITYIFKEKE
ncbi:MAG: rhomboid family intramembrane serine protease [Bacteroidota bacterium]